MNEENNFTNNFENYPKEINLRHFLNFLLRKRKLISSITIIFILIGFTAQKIIKKTWAGEFQIVLSNEKRNASEITDQLSILRSFGEAAGTDNKLLTEVGILESPSVLMPIFEYVKNEKKSIRPRKKDLLFLNWKRNLNIDLKKDTSILEITYKDNDKELIIPVLDKMSKAFQVYSGKSKARNLFLNKDYLINQISFYKSKSAQSIKKAQEFAIKEDLLIQDALPLEFGRKLGNDSFNPSLFMPYKNTTIESTRVAAANKIRTLKEQIPKIKELNDIQQLRYITSTDPGLQENSSIKIIEEIESQILDLKSRYTEENREIKILSDKKELLIDVYKEQLIGMLKAQILQTEAKLKSATRPDDVILKYKGLIREAEMDEMTLLQLENQYRALLLEEARAEDPWELITIPTLLDRPVYPTLTSFLIFSFLGGLGFSIIVGKYLEKKSDLIYEKDILEESLSLPILFESNGLVLNSRNSDPIIINQIINQKDKVFFMPSDNVNDKLLDYYKKNIKEIYQNNSDKKDPITKNFNYDEISSSDSLFLLIDLKKLTYKELKKLKNRLELFALHPDGIILSI